MNKKDGGELVPVLERGILKGKGDSACSYAAPRPEEVGHEVSERLEGQKAVCDPEIREEIIRTSRKKGRR